MIQVLVLGMPCSGAAQISRLLGAMGVRLISEECSAFDHEDMADISARSWFWRLHKPMLDACDADWNRLHDFDATRIPNEVIQRFRNEATDILRATDDGAPRGLYHPLLCLFASQWRRLLKPAVSVYVYRHPVEIAMALQNRYGYAIPFGLALWEQYLIQSLTGAEREHCLLTSYHDLIERPVEVTRRLFKQLSKSGIPGLRKPDSDLINLTVERHGDLIDAPDRLLKEWGNARQAKLSQRFRKGLLFGGERLKISQGALERLRAFARNQRRSLDDDQNEVGMNKTVERDKSRLYWNEKWIKNMVNDLTKLTRSPALVQHPDAEIQDRIKNIQAIVSEWPGRDGEDLLPPRPPLPATSAVDEKFRGKTLLENEPVNGLEPVTVRKTGPGPFRTENR